MSRRKTKRRQSRKRRRKQKAGALFRRKPRTIDKIAEIASIFLSGPKPTFGSLGLLLGKQAFKGIKDNVNHYRSRTRR